MGTTRRRPDGAPLRDAAEVTGPLPTLQELETSGVLTGAYWWTSFTIAVGSACALAIAFLVPADRVPLLLVILVSVTTLLIMRRPRFRWLWEAGAGTVAVVGITASAWFSGGPASPLRHLLIIPIVYVAGMHGWAHILGITALTVLGRIVLLTGEPLTAQALAGTAVQVVVALILALATYTLRASLGRASRELERTDELHRVLVQSNANAVYVLDDQGRFLEANRRVAELVGVPVAELVGRSSLSFIPHELREESRRLFERAVAGEPQTFESALLRSDGERVPVLITNVRIRLPGGGTAVHGVASDLTPTLRERRAREASERRFQRLAESTQDGIYVVRNRGGEREYLYVNPAMTELTGVPAEEFHRDPSVAERYVDSEDARQLIRENRRGEPYPTAVLLRWNHPDGARWLELNEVPYEDDAGEVVGVQGIVHDVTHLVRQQEESDAALEREQAAVEHLRRVDEMKNAFLQSVSHELRTPLTSVVGLADTVVMHLDALTPDQVRLLLSRTVVNARKLERLLSDLLDVDRMARGVLVPSLAEVDLAEVASRVLDESEELGGTVVVELQPTVVVADAPKIERVIENLLHNAVRHNPEGTAVWLRVAPTPDGAEIVVEDEGTGIDPGLRDVLFEPFAQGEASASAAKPGTGIGLALVARFTELHGGRVTAEERPGGGARFRVWLPARGPGSA